MKRFFTYLLLVATLFGAAGGVAQPVANPVVWSSSAEEISEGEYDVVFSAVIAPPWYMYDLGPYDMFPNATAFSFEPDRGVELVGEVRYGIEPARKFDGIFEKTTGYFRDKASFIQRVKVTGGDVVLRVGVEFQVCNDESCLAPAGHIFSVALKGAAAVGATGADLSAISKPYAADGSAGRSLWSMLLEALLWGFAALLTPCVFPMVPLTVSFFLRANEGKSRARGRFMAFGLRAFDNSPVYRARSPDNIYHVSCRGAGCCSFGI